MIKMKQGIRMKKIIVLAIAAAIASSSFASDNWFGSSNNWFGGNWFGEEEHLGNAVMSGFLSKHIGTNRNFNENNYGIGFRSDSGYAFGYYRNSIDKDGFYLAKEFQWKTPIEYINFGLFAGVVNGYKGLSTKYNTDVYPLLLPELLVKVKPLSSELSFIVIPRVKDVTPTTFSVQARYIF